MKAVIMAGGEGTRLRPLTCGRPKPMVPVANKPVMEYIVELLRKHGFLNVAATLHYMPDMISDYFGDGESFGIKMRYYIEQKPLGTAGSVKNAESFLDDTFLVISGDALTDIDIRGAVEFHKERNATATLILKKVDVPLEYGVVVTDQEGRIVRFLEKPGWGEVFSDTVNTGIYILSPEIFDYIKKNEVFDFSKDLFPVMLKENKPMYGYVTDDYWCDIGDINAYLQSNADILDGKIKASLPGVEREKGLWIGSGTVIDEGAVLEAPCLIGSNCHIKEGAKVYGYSVIGDNSVISGQCGIKKSIVWKNCNLSDNVQLRGGILCDRVFMDQGVSAFEQSVVGNNSTVGERAIIKPGVKIWPDKSVMQGTEVGSNLVWGSKTEKRIFGNRSVAGKVNIDITPEFAARLGASFGSVCGNGGSIGVGSDGSPASQMIKIALVSGLLSSGVRVNDFGRLMLPALRQAVRFYRLDGGIYINNCRKTSSRLFIEFLDKTGSNIDRNMERKIENAFARDDFNRCEGDCLKSVLEICGFQDFYLKSIAQGLKSERLNYRILLKTHTEDFTGIISSFLTELGCEVVIYGHDAGNYKEKPGNRQAGVANFCKAARDGLYDIGVSIEESCEKMMLVDSKGRLVTDDMFIALISLVLFMKIRGGTVIVPLSASQAVERIAEKYDGNVIRAKTSAGEIMKMFLGKDAKETLLEQFTYHFDAVAGFVKLLDHMSVNRLGLSDLVDMLPEIHMRRQEVECSWSAKGRVIRKLIQEHTGDNVETLEGFKLHNDNGWVLVIPDAERPVCSVIGEGINAEFAEELTNIYVRKVREISRG